MLLGFPLWLVLGGLIKSTSMAESAGMATNAAGKDNNFFFHPKYCCQSCYLAAKAQNDAK